MALDRQLNIRGQMRIDVPHLRSIESGIAHDFDILVGGYLAGRQPVVIKGFSVIPPTGTVSATSLQLSVAGSILSHYGASETGSLFAVPDDRAIETLNASNSRVSGGFVAGQVNYVGVDIVRSEDASTADIAQFLDASTLTETPKTIPLGRTADYVIVISSTPFTSNGNVAPVAIITTNSQNQVSTASIKDARNLMFRLGSGGDSPNAKAVYSWPGGRVEGAASDFANGDKAIVSEKDWKSAVMHRIWELGGGDTWYAPSSAASIRLVKDPTSVFAGGDNFEIVANNLHWKGLSVAFDNSPGAWKNTVANQLTDSAGLTDLAAGECLYVDLDRTQIATVSAQKATLQSLGAATIPGARLILAWCTATGTIYTRDFPLQVGASFAGVAGTASLGTVRIASVGPNASLPVVPVMDNNNVAVATGISRSSTGGTSLANGVFSIATGAADTSVVLGQGSATFTVNSSGSTFANAITVTAGGVKATVFDVASAGTLSIGTATATAITIGKTGVTATIPGALTVTQTLTASATVVAPGVDRAGTLDLGVTNATAVNISKTGVLTKVFGNFEVAGTTALTGALSVDTIQSKTGASPVTISDDLAVTGAIFGDTIASKTAAGVLSIGVTTQTGDITIGRSTKTTTIGGNLAITGTFTPNSTIVLNAANGIDANGKTITNLPSPTPGSTEPATAAYAESKATAAQTAAITSATTNLNNFKNTMGYAYWNGAGCVLSHNCQIFKATGTGNYYVSGLAVTANSVILPVVVGDGGERQFVTVKKFSMGTNAHYYEIQDTNGDGRDMAHIVMVMTS